MFKSAFPATSFPCSYTLVQDTVSYEFPVLPPGILIVLFELDLEMFPADWGVKKRGLESINVFMSVTIAQKKIATCPKEACICLSVHQYVLGWCSTQFHSLSKTQSAASFSPNPAPVLLMSSQHLSLLLNIDNGEHDYAERRVWEKITRN